MRPFTINKLLNDNKKPVENAEAKSHPESKAVILESQAATPHPEYQRIPAKPEKAQINFNVLPVDSTPFEKESHLPLPPKSNNFHVTEVKVQPLIYDDVPDDEEMGRVDSEATITNILKPSTERKKAILAYLKSENIKPIPYNEELTYEMNQYWHDTVTNEVYLFNDEQGAAIYRIVVHLQSPEVFLKTVKDARLFQQLHSSTTAAFENRTNFFSKNTDLSIVRESTNHAFSYFYSKQISKEVKKENLAESVESDVGVLTGPNKLLLQRTSVATQIGNLILDAFMNINFLQKQAAYDTLKTSTYNNVILFNTKSDSELLKLISNLATYNQSAFSALLEAKEITSPIPDKKTHDIIMGYLILHAHDKNMNPPIPPEKYQELRKVLVTESAAIGIELLGLLQKQRVLEIVPLDLPPSPITKNPRLKVPHIRFVGKTIDYLITSSTYTKPRIITNDVNTTYIAIGDTQKEIHIEVKKPSNIYTRKIQKNIILNLN